MVAFIIGLIIGIVFGFLVCAVLSASGREEEMRERMPKEEKEDTTTCH